MANDPFDARRLASDERRFLQAALGFAGPYLGLLDGDWGRGSQSALETALGHIAPSDITFGHLRPLVARMAGEHPLSSGER